MPICVLNPATRSGTATSDLNRSRRLARFGRPRQNLVLHINGPVPGSLRQYQDGLARNGHLFAGGVEDLAAHNCDAATTMRNCGSCSEQSAIRQDRA